MAELYVVVCALPTEHIGLDHLPYVSTFIADWVAGTFAADPPGYPAVRSSA